MDDKNAHEESPIERLSQEIYSKEKDTKTNRLGLEREAPNLPTDWQSGRPDIPMKRKTPIIESKIPTYLLLGSLIFLAVAVGIAAFIFSRGANIVSSRNINLKVEGPVSVDSGELLELMIEVENRNATTLETADLLLEFPPGTRDPENPGRELERYRESLGDIRSGERVEKDIAALAFGTEGDKKDIIVSVEYRLADSNAIFVKEKLYSFEIRSVPLDILVDIPEEVNSGQDMEIRVEVVSNSTKDSGEVLLFAEYPFGFDFKGASPPPSGGENTWRFGNIAPGEREAITLHGTIEAEDGEERTFRFSLGLPDPDDAERIKTELTSSEYTLSIARAFISLDVALEGSRSEMLTAESGQDIRADISWRNNLREQVSDVVIEARIEGEALDERSVVVQGGFYRSNDNLIFWDKTTREDLALLDSGESGRASFSFRSLDLSSSAAIREPEIRLIFTISARRTGGGGGQEILETMPARIVKIATNISLDSKALYHLGPFENSGPLPPVADTETSYTVVWSITNPSSDATGVRVRASLPPYVTFAGNIEPSGEDVRFIASENEIVWNVGDVLAGTGFKTPKEEVAFQIRFLPSISQIGTSPILLHVATLAGQDSFTRAPLQDATPSLTTRLTSDEGVTDAESRVVAP